MKYHKIPTVWNRDPKTKHRTLIDRAWATDELAALSDVSMWDITEKVDGTNIRVTWDGDHVAFGGRTDRAQIPADLVAKLNSMFTCEDFESAEMPAMTIYGEGFGKGIQKVGKRYRVDRVDFCAFDIMCGGVWLERNNIEDICGRLGVPVVPRLAVETLLFGIGMVQGEIHSQIADDTTLVAEGVVMRAPCGVLDRHGNRIICKVKAKDFGDV